MSFVLSDTIFTMKKVLRILIVFISFLSIRQANARGHYSFELAEKLKPLIEWRDYGTEDLEEAVAQNKPIFLLLTAPSWCHWCQVYESEEYLFDPSVYSYINKNLIPIYVDADKRQDLTRQWLEGGWPSTTILDPARNRLFGYSGPRPIQWMQANLDQVSVFVNSRVFSNKQQLNYIK